MTVGGRLVRTGVLRKKSWGYALEEPDGSVWRLDIVPPPDRMIGRPVVIDGIRADFDMIDVIGIRERAGVWPVRWAHWRFWQRRVRK